MIEFNRISADALPDHLGLIPMMFSAFDPAPAKDQIDRNYSHGGGYRPQRGFKALSRGRIQYPGDPPMNPLFEGLLRDETIRVYESGWVAVVQKDGSFEVTRMD